MSDYQLPNYYDNYLGQYGVSPRKKPSVPTQATPDFTPEENKSLLGELGEAGLGALSTVGNVLDTPGSVVRGLLAGEPGKAFGGIFDPSQRVQPEDLTGLKSNESDDFLTKAGKFAGNLGVGVATDPLFWLGGGVMGAPSKAANVLKRAGVLEKGTNWAELAGKQVGQIGRREAMMTTKAGDALDQLVTSNPLLNPAEKAAKMAAVDKAAAGLKPNLFDRLSGRPQQTFAEMADKPLGNLFNVGPFGGGSNPWGSVGNGKIAQTVARGLDKAGRAVRYGKYSPIYHMEPLFNANLQGIKDPLAAEAGLGQKMTTAVERGDVAARQGQVDLFNLLEPTGFGLKDDPKLAMGREAIDQLFANPQAHAPARDAIGQLISSTNPNDIASAKASLQALGLSPEHAEALHTTLGDLAYAGHAPKEMQYLGSATSLDPTGDLNRLKKLTGDLVDPQRTDLNRLLLKDPALSGEAVQRLQTRHGMDPATVQQIQDLLEKTRSGRVQEQAKAFGANARELGDLHEEYMARSTNPEAFPGAHAAGNSMDRFNTFGSDEIARNPVLKNNPLGTSQWDQMMADSRLDDAIAGVKPEKQVKELAKAMQNLYGENALGPHGVSPEYFGNTEWGKLQDTLNARNEAALKAGTPITTLDDLRDPTILADLAKDAGVSPATDRFEELAKMRLLSKPEYRSAANPLFNEAPMYPVGRMIRQPSKRTAQADFLAGVLALPGKLGEVRKGISPDMGTTVGELATQASLLHGDAQNGFLTQLAQKMGADPTNPDYPKLLNKLKDTVIEPKTLQQLNNWVKRTTAPENQKQVAGLYDKLMTLWKAGMVTHPGFVARNTGSMAVQSGINDMFDMAKMKQAFGTLQGADESIGKNAFVQGAAGDYGLTYADPQAARTAQGWASQIPGGVKGLAEPFSWKGFAKDITGRSEGTTLNPFKATMPGFEKSVTGKEGLEWAPFKGMQRLTRLSEQSARLQPYLKLIDEGIDPQVAAEMVNDTHFRYGPQAFTPFEKQFVQRVIPFAKFSKGAMVDTVNQLMKNPGGKLGQTLRATNALRGDNGEITPDYLNSSLAIPIPEGTPLIGPEAGGAPRFLTGMGLIHEDPIGFLGGGPLGMGAELISRASPLIKAPLEAITGKSFFQRGGQGLRDIEEQDPLLGRIGSNVRDLITGGRTKRATPVPLLEELAANSPISRVLSSTRILTDPRKNWLTSLLNVGTGMRLTDVPESAIDAQSERTLQGLMKDSGARTAENVYFPRDTLAAMSPEQQRKAGLLMAYKKYLDKRRRERGKAA